jgi:uncharacterized protein YacL
MLDIAQTIVIIFMAWFILSQKNLTMAQLFNKRRKIILDSCALIDGRIIEIVNAGFVADELVIPQFILNELQMLADGSDAHKRERARFGLDIAHQLQDAAPVPVVIDRTVFPEAAAIDDKLVLLAKKLRAQLYTTDFNLGKVSAVEGIKVLNINELTQSLRPVSLPGETLTIKIIQKGSNQGQGVGYLEDGTMIVVDGAARYIGRSVPVIVTRMHQTVAGKMVFGQVRNERQQAAESSASAPKTESKVAASAAHSPKKQPRAVHSTARTPASAGGKLHGRLQKLRRRPSVV